MENSGGIQASLAGRYATALFDLARDSKALDTVERDLAGLKQALAESDDFRALASSPLLSRDNAAKGVAAVAKSLGLSELTTNFLGVLAANRRLGQLGQVIRAFAHLAGAHRGEITADVTTAHPLDAAQVEALKAKLKARVGGADVAINQIVNADILGGLVVKIGSQMIDSSIRTKLNTLAHAMKG